MRHKNRPHALEGCRLRERILWGGLVIVILSWTGNYLYFQAQQLEQPIFLEHYYETSMREQDTIEFTFYYLSNKRNPSEVLYVNVDGVDGYPAPETDFQMWTTTTNVPQYEQEFSHHYLKSVVLQFQSSFLPIKKGSDVIWSFDKIDVTFKDGQTITADIGNVKVYGDEPDYEIFDEQISSSSNQHWSQKSMVTTQPLTIEEITVPFPKEVAKDVYVKLNLTQLPSSKYEEDEPEWFEDLVDLKRNKMEGISIAAPIFPLSLKENDWLQLSMRFNPNRESYYDFGIEMKGTTDENNPFLYKAPIIDSPYFSQQKVDDIIKEHQGVNGR